MNKKHEKFGTYYGELIKVDSSTEYEFSDFSVKETQEFIAELEKSGVKEIYLDLEPGCIFSDTMFFKTDDSADFKHLLGVITIMRPHEFSEVSEHHWRMWFD
jgi:CTP:phosphocholine cytidylyltransferase-like protein